MRRAVLAIDAEQPVYEAQPMQLLPIVLGLGIRTLIAALTAQAARTLWFGVGAYNPETYVLANLVVLLVAVGVAFTTVLRVMRIDPAIAIRTAQ